MADRARGRGRAAGRDQPVPSLTEIDGGSPSPEMAARSRPARKRDRVASAGRLRDRYRCSRLHGRHGPARRRLGRNRTRHGVSAILGQQMEEAAAPLHAGRAAVRGAGEPHGVQAQLLAGVGGLVWVLLEAELVTGTEAPDQELVAVVFLEAPEREQPRLGTAFGAEVDDVRAKAERPAGGRVKVEAWLPAVGAQFQRTGLRHHQLEVLCDRPDVRGGDDQRAAGVRAEARGGDLHLQRSRQVQGAARDLQGDRLAKEAVRAGQDPACRGRPASPTRSGRPDPLRRGRPPRARRP